MVRRVATRPCGLSSLYGARAVSTAARATQVAMAGTASTEVDEDARDGASPPRDWVDRSFPLAKSTAEDATAESRQPLSIRLLGGGWTPSRVPCHGGLIGCRWWRGVVLVP